MPEAPFPLREECPPGLCDCGRDALLADPAGDRRVLRLTRHEERRLIERIERIDSHADLLHVGRLLHEQLGIRLTILPGPNEVRTVRGIIIRLEEQPGLCRKIRQSVPAAIRRVLDARQEIAWAILDAHGLFGGG